MKTLLFLVLCWGTSFAVAQATAGMPPNVIFILADDLGYNEIGPYGQTKIRTPNLDSLAESGITFTQFYAGAPVCATSRSVLMTGQHAGHTRVRGNAFPEDNGKQELLDEDFTLAELFKTAGYKTALVGKWGLGMQNTQGHPNKQGFDHFFGYLSQHHAHNYYPTYLWRNELKVGLPNINLPMGNGRIYGAGVAPIRGRNLYAPDLFVEEAVDFINQNATEPFFLYFATNVPHSNNEATQLRRADGAEVPDLGRYEGEVWQEGAKRHAAMITRMDGDIGTIIDTLESLNIREDTIIVFSSDNGPHVDHTEPLEFFEPSEPLIGWKMELAEGGLRVPTIISWPSLIETPRQSNAVAYFGDFMATFAAILGVEAPDDLDSNSFLPVLKREHEAFVSSEFLYWEFNGKEKGVVVRMDGRWKGILRSRVVNGHRRAAPFELFDLHNDIKEANDVSVLHPEISAAILDYMKKARTHSENWPPVIDFTTY